MAALYDTDEREPLLHGASVIPQPPSDFSLFCSLLFDSIPVILSYTLQNSLQAVSILIVAQLGPAEFSAASVALMLAFVTGESLDYLIYGPMIPHPVVYYRMVRCTRRVHSSGHPRIAVIYWRESSHRSVHSPPEMHCIAVGSSSACMHLVGLYGAHSSWSWTTKTTQ